MKRIFAFLLLFIPTFCLADACTNQNEYTIDKRCYVTDSIWKNRPYKHILKMYDNAENIVFCTANMVAGKIVTAKHCVENKDVSNITFIAHTGTRISVQYINTETNLYDYAPISQDWVVLTPKAEFQNFVKENSIYNVQDFSDFADSSFVIIGYGGLKILNDKEIKNLKKAYFEYLQATDAANSSIKDDKTASVNQKIGGFKDAITSYLHKYGFNSAEDVFMDTNKMKLSICAYVENLSELNMISAKCQVWAGNSGGGLYGIRNVITKTDAVSDDLCDNYNDCGFCGVFVISGSFISTDPSSHVSKKAVVVPITEIKKTLESSY